MKFKNADLGKLNLSFDFLKALVVAGFSSVIGALYPIISSKIQTGEFKFDWDEIGSMALGSFITGALGYLSKQLSSNSDGVPFKGE